MKTIFKLTIALVICGAWLIGCDRGKPNATAGTSSSGDSLKLAFVTNNASEFWKIAAAGVHRYEKEAGVQVDLKMPPNGKVEEQNQIIESLVSQGYNGIAVSAIAPNDQVGAINKAAAKTVVICFDSDAPKSNRKLYIGTLNFEAGKILGNEIIKLLPNRGRIRGFFSTPSADQAPAGPRGTGETIKGHQK